MTKTLSHRSAVRLSYQDGQVMVTSKDQDIFFVSAEKATEACSNHIRQEERVARFKTEIILPIARWCEAHKDRVSACYVLVPESAVLPVYVVGASERYDFHLAELLSDFALRFEEQGWSVHLSQIPQCEPEQLCGFFNPENAIQVYGG